MSVLHEVWGELIHGRMVWNSYDLAADNSWVHELTCAEVTDLVHSFGNVDERRSELRASVPLFAKVGMELDQGRGLFLLRGVSVGNGGSDAFLEFGCSLAAHLRCSLAPQNMSGDLFSLVFDRGAVDSSDAQGRGHRSRAEMGHHSDSCDIAALFCVNSAMEGGATLVCSSAAVYNAILKEAPRYLTALGRGFHFDMVGKTLDGMSRQETSIFSFDGGEFKCRYNRSRIEIGMRKSEKPLTDEEFSALEFMSSVTRRLDQSLRLNLLPGDILLVNNSRVLHARDGYVDWPEPERRRLLVRFWLNRQHGVKGPAPW